MLSQSSAEPDHPAHITPPLAGSQHKGRVGASMSLFAQTPKKTNPESDSGLGGCL